MPIAAGYALVTLLLFVVHSFLVPYLSVLHVQPDILIIWIVYIAIRRGQMAGTVAGFLIGLLLDLAAGEGGMLGLSSLAKSVSGFVAGYFFNENKTLQTLGGYQMIVIVLLTSVVHHLLYFVIFLQGTDTGMGAMVWHNAVPGALYNALVSLLPMLVFSRKLGT